MAAKTMATKKKVTKEADGPPIPVNDGHNLGPAEPDPNEVPAADTKPVAEQPLSAKDLPIEFHTIEMPLCAPVELARTPTIIPAGEDRATIGVNSQSYIEGHLSAKQQIGFYRLRSALERQEQLVGNVHGRGKKTVDTGIDAIRWLLEQLAEVE
ncbi:MAG: hypothetical protein AAGI37_17875 [Planctomycetota bacterium]